VSSKFRSRSDATATKTPFLADIFPSRHFAEFIVVLANIPGALDAVEVSDRVSSRSSWIKKGEEMQKPIERLLQLESNACWRS
jgi:hypothetical protein